MMIAIAIKGTEGHKGTRAKNTYTLTACTLMHFLVVILEFKVRIPDVRWRAFLFAELEAITL